MILLSSSLFANGNRLPVGAGAEVWKLRTGFMHTLFGGQDPVDQFMPVHDLRWQVTAVEIEDDLAGFTTDGGSPIPFEVKQNGNMTIPHRFMAAAVAKGWVCNMRPGITPTGLLGEIDQGGGSAEYQPVRIADWLAQYGRGLGDLLDPDRPGSVPYYQEHLVPRFYVVSPDGKWLVRDGTGQVTTVTDLKLPVMLGTCIENKVRPPSRRELAAALLEAGVSSIGLGLPVKERSALEAVAKVTVFQLDGTLEDVRATIHRHATALTRAAV